MIRTYQLAENQRKKEKAELQHTNGKLLGTHRCGNDFLAGQQELNDFSVWGSKNWRKTIKTIKFKV